MKQVQAGAFFIDLNAQIVDRQLKKLRQLIINLQTKFGSEVVSPLTSNQIDQLTQLWVQSMSIKRVPLLIMPSNQHRLLVNNINLAANVQFKNDAQLFQYLQSLSPHRIVDIHGTTITVDELIQLIQTQHPMKSIRILNLGQSLINNTNVLHDEQYLLTNDFHQSDWQVNTYVISLKPSLVAEHQLFKQIDSLSDMIVPASLDVQRDLAEYLLLNFRVQLIKLSKAKVPVLYLPQVDNAFGIFQLLENPQIVIEKWQNRQFTKVDASQLISLLLSNSKFTGSKLTKLPRLPITDDPSGKQRKLIQGQNKQVNDGPHYFDVMTR